MSLVTSFCFQQLLPMHAPDLKDCSFRTSGSAVDFLACFFSINPCEGLMETDRFVQGPPCSPAFSSLASNDERVNGKPLKTAGSLA